MGDEELDRLRRRKMLELKRKMLQASSSPKKTEKPASSEEVLDPFFYDRAWEVYRAAKAQYPTVMDKVEKALLEAIKARKIKEKISGEDLVNFFEQIGIPVRLEIQIRYKEHGELKTLEQKLRERK